MRRWYVGHTKKVVTNAVLFLGYCTGNIAGPFFYKTNQSYAPFFVPLILTHVNNTCRPTYSLGIWSMIGSHLIEAVLISTLGLLRWENKKRDRIQSEMEGGLQGRDLDATAFLDLTDRENLKYVILLFVSEEKANTFVLLVSGISIETRLGEILNLDKQCSGIECCR